MTKMISLDTSSTITGYAYFENAKYKKSGILYHADEKDSVIRMEDMCIDIIKTLNKYKPDIVVIEKPPFCNSPEVLMMLSEIIGCARGWSLTYCSEFVEYRANEWRKLIADPDEKIPRKRDECKDWDVDKFHYYFNTEEEDDNEADAALIGLARIKQFGKE